jgi:hypothetical protein
LITTAAPDDGSNNTRHNVHTQTGHDCASAGSAVLTTPVFAACMDSPESRVIRRIPPVQRAQCGLALIHVNSNYGKSDKNKTAASPRIPAMNTNQQGSDSVQATAMMDALTTWANS